MNKNIKDLFSEAIELLNDPIKNKDNRIQVKIAVIGELAEIEITKIGNINPNKPCVNLDKV